MRTVVVDAALVLAVVCELICVVGVAAGATVYDRIHYSGAKLDTLAPALQAQGWEIEDSQPGSVTVRQDLADDEFEPAYRRLKRTLRGDGR